MKYLQPSLVFTLALVCLLNTTHANDVLKMALSANKVIISANGKVTYTPISTAVVGTVVQYKATYHNTVNQDIQDLTVVLPIPANMTFTGEAIPVSAQASIDNKNYADMPLIRKIDGKLVKIPLSEYKSLRWNIKLLPASKSANVALNTIVN